MNCIQCGICKKYCKASDRLLECEECEKRFHAPGDDEHLRIESDDGACTNCKADCGPCSGAVLNGHKAVQCDNCDMWIHNECSFITETQYETVKNIETVQTVHGFARNMNSLTFLIPSLVNR